MNPVLSHAVSLRFRGEKSDDCKQFSRKTWILAVVIPTPMGGMGNNSNSRSTCFCIVVDYEAAAKKIYDTPELENFEGDRLFEGK